MLAHYLLGRCYDDMGEAPAALQEFHNAADAVDTTAINCNYQVLSRVHSQLAALLTNQELPYNALSELGKVDYYSRLCKDTFTILVNRERMAIAYEELGISDSVISIRENVAAEFKRKGLKQDAAITLAPTIDNLIEKGRLQKAKSYMDFFENQSGFFHGDKIKEGLEIYYYSKGLYYLQTSRLDSARIYFYRLLDAAKHPRQLESAYKGLSLLFQVTGKIDSSAIYARKALEMNDSTYRLKSTSYFQRMQSMYNYSRHKLIAAKERSLRQHISITFYQYAVISIIIFIVFALIIWKLRRNVINQRRIKDEIESKYTQLMEDIDNKKLLEESQSANKELIIQRMNVRIDELKDTIVRLEKSIKGTSIQKKDVKPIIDPTINAFKKKIISHPHDINKSDWNDVVSIIKDNLPDFYQTVYYCNPNLKTEEIEMCILIRLGVPLKSIATYLNISMQLLSVSRKRLLKKIFNIDNGGAKNTDVMLLSLN